MTSPGKHHKHPQLRKPDYGEWGRHEFAILGAPCGKIREVADALTVYLSQWKVCFADADHAGTDTQDEPPFAGEVLYTDRIHSRRLDVRTDPGSFERRRWMSACDIILVNGNHFSAKAQIVLLHSKKLESLQRKADRLTNVVAVLEMDTTMDACPWLNPYLSPETQVFRRHERPRFEAWFAKNIAPPEIRGLVLAGGKSTRMGSDKSVIAYHGRPQRQHLLSLFNEVGVQGYLSCRPDQADAMQDESELIVDRVTDLGPYGAILSAMMSEPNSAWLVIATDLPFVNAATLQYLITHRNPAKLATAFYNPTTAFPEPLITLWEPKAYAVLLDYLSQGIACPRKVLINADAHVIQAEDPRWLDNVNTPEEMQAVREALG